MAEREMKLENRSINVLHVIGSLIAGGAERFVVELLPNLKKRGLDVGLLVLSSKEDNVGKSMRRFLIRESIPFSVGPTRIVRFRSAMWYARKLFETNPRIVHLHTPNTELAHFIGTKFYRKKHHIVRTLHSTNIPPKCSYWFSLRRNRAAVSIACSNGVEDRFRNEIHKDIRTIHNGVQFKWPIRTYDLSKKYKKKLGLRGDRFHILNIGRQSGEKLETAPKAQDVLMKAWRKGELGSRGNELHMVGDGNLAYDLKALANGDPSVHFHGVQDNVNEWLLACDCFAMPSRFEGFPIAAIEATGTGLPCIFSDIAPLKELKWPATSFVAPDDVDALVRSLLKARETSFELGAAEAGRIRERFGMEVTAERYAECYLSIARL